MPIYDSYWPVHAYSIKCFFPNALSALIIFIPTPIILIICTKLFIDNRSLLIIRFSLVVGLCPTWIRILFLRNLSFIHWRLSFCTLQIHLIITDINFCNFLLIVIFNCFFILTLLSLTIFTHFLFNWVICYLHFC